MGLVDPLTDVVLASGIIDVDIHKMLRGNINELLIRLIRVEHFLTKAQIKGNSCGTVFGAVCKMPNHLFCGVRHGALKKVGHGCRGNHAVFQHDISDRNG